MAGGDRGDRGLGEVWADAASRSSSVCEAASVVGAATRRTISVRWSTLGEEGRSLGNDGATSRLISLVTTHSSTGVVTNGSTPPLLHVVELCWGGSDWLCWCWFASALVEVLLLLIVRSSSSLGAVESQPNSLYGGGEDCGCVLW